MAREIAPLIKPGALILALQNGVDNPERIAAEVACPVIPAVVYVACNMGGPGHLRHTGRGDLVIGAMRGARVPPTSAQVEALAALLEKSGVPCKISPNVEGELWGKLLINCTYNPLSALGRSRYKRITALEDTRALMRSIVRGAALCKRRPLALAGSTTASPLPPPGYSRPPRACRSCRWPPCPMT